jgi:hypothetical protein
MYGAADASLLRRFCKDLNTPYKVELFLCTGRSSLGMQSDARCDLLCSA